MRLNDIQMNSVNKNTCSFSTLPAMLAHLAIAFADNPAIEAPGREALCHKRLWVHVTKISECLKAAGVCATDRVVLLLPNGPEMAVAFLATTSVACAAPLNPTYRNKELEFYFSDLRPKVLLVGACMDTPARELAITQGITVIEVTPCEQAAAGIFTLSIRENSKPDKGGCDDAGEIHSSSTALILHTSGTTSKPKQVPLSHENILASIANIIDVLKLDANDCGLNIMPLFHIHGLIAALLAPLACGGRVVCSPGLDPDCFFDWLSAYSPTWYSAVPTMHQIILEHASSKDIHLEHSTLRFIRSSSAALPPRVLQQLEACFKCPVIEAYGMTEATHQIASNPLPPQHHKPGSVGLPAGSEIAIMDNQGQLLEQGETGEIVIRGDNITAGYANNPAANRDNFTDGWFRTGDQGHLDSDGYLFITGRLKEIINRGGENIQPREIDEALMDLDGVRQAVAFSRPHPTLGEDLAAAVTITPESGLSAADIRAFAFERLADYKVPSQVIIVDEIPKGATGKLQRLGLAELLDEQLTHEHAEPGNDMEQLIHDIFCEVLGLNTIGIHDNFFALGGDSIRGTHVITRLQTRVHIELPSVILFHKPTVAELADHVTTSTDYLDADAITGILAELDKLSDEEARDLVASLEKL
jgi:acyl-CoA synthetase (AMP-forming)/AMP-acid ligase II/acyl carrier protein